MILVCVVRRGRDVSRVPKFSIIIVSYQSADWIAACLDGLAKQTVQDFETIVVDNASTDQSVEIASQSQLSQLQIIRNSENFGFAKACNIGARVALSEWVIFLNPDTVARPDWLEQIVDGQDRYPETAAFACAQYELGQTGTLDGVGDAYFGFGIPWRGGFGHPSSMLPEEGECFSPCGAAAIVRKDKFDLLGGFDEDFFCYCEDVDLGFRLRLMGERCVFLNKAAIDHKGSAISGRHSKFTTYHGTRNRMWTYFKNMPLPLLLLTLPGHILLSLVLLLRAIPQGRFMPTLKGLKDGILGLRAILKARKADPPKVANRADLTKAMSWNFGALLQRRPDVHEFEGRSSAP